MRPSRGAVTACEPPTLLAFLWGTGEGASEVRFDLAEAGPSVHLTLTHARLVQPREIVMVSTGWHIHLDILVAVVEGREPEGFWRRFAALEPEYASGRAGG